MDLQTVIVVIAILVLIYVFRVQLMVILNNLKDKAMSYLSCKKMDKLPDDDDKKKTVATPASKQENLEVDPKANSANTYQPDESDTLRALGYSGNMPWDEVIASTELDPATFINHKEFVKDVRRFSSGAGFTSISDDNNSFAFVNFQGLRRGNAIPNMIGGTARQIPDIDESVLTREKVFRWNSTS